MIFRRILSTLLLAGCIFFSAAQPSPNTSRDLKFKHFTSANGLSQRSVMAIVQDKKGYLWFGTRDGLNKFDGNKFIVYRHSAAASTELSNNNIHSLYEDSYGNLWIGTQMGLNKYNPEKDNFIHYGDSGGRDGMTDNIIRGIAQVSDELLWAATDDGILQVHIKTGTVQRIQKQNNNPNSISDNKIRYFLKTGDGMIWICNTRFIDVYDPQTKKFKHISYPRQNNSSIHLNDLPTLYTDRKNTLWLGYEQGLAVFDPANDSFTDFKFDGHTAINVAVRSMYEDLSGNLWIGTYAGLYILNAEHTRLDHIEHDDDNATSLSQNSIYKIIRDARGDMWLGTWADGLNYYNKDNQAYKNIAFGNGGNKLSYRVVSGMAEDSAGNLWIGTEGGGLNFYNRQTKQIATYKNNPADENSLSANNVKAVIIDKKGILWIGMHDGGVNYLDPRQHPYRFQPVDFPKGTTVPLKGYKVLTLATDKNGNIWIGTLTGGLIFYDVHAKKLFKTDNDIKSVMSIVPTQDPDILLAGGNKGIEAVNINTGEKTKVTINGATGGNHPLNVNALFIDPLNNYWIGTEGDGLYVYNPGSKKITVYSTREGLPNDIVYGILPDASGNIWISTNNGISRLETASGKIKNYNQDDGLQGNEFNYGSFYKTRNGELFFGGTNGLTYFNPKDIQKNNFVPNVDITNIEVNNAPYKRITDAVKTIRLQYNENNLSIDFTALSYMYPEKSEFAYKLEGIDEDWVYSGNQRKAVYTKIPAGNYVFRVKGANSDGVWNENGDTLKIRILPAPWRTWWAYLIYTAAFAAIFLYIRKLILARTRERKEKERIKEINQLKLNLFTEVSHDFRTPLTLIAGPLKEMIDKKAGDAYVQQQHATMYRNTSILLQLVTEILDFSKIESEALTLRTSLDNIVPVVEEVKESFDVLAQKRNIHYTFVTNQKDIPVWFDKIQLRKVLFNLLSNAFKFTDNNKEIAITITASGQESGTHSEKSVSITITNSGIVLSEEEVRRIFDPFFQLTHKNEHLGSGIGLSIVKKLVELHKGSIEVTSSEAAGTSFTIFLKQGSPHLSEAQRFSKPGVEEDTMQHMRAVIPETVSLPQDDENIVEETENDRPVLLIVEDNPEVQQFIRQLFIDNYTVFLARNGQEAIERAQQKPVDLIISDVQMPVMDGFEFCKKIKTTLETSHILVILLTAKTAPIHQEKGYRTGADAYITKPFDASLLKLKVANAIETRAKLIQKFKKDTLLEPKKLTTSSPDEIFLQRAIAVVNENIDNPEFNANLFVIKMLMSRTVLYTKLRALTGQNITGFIRSVRLKKAAALMVQSHMTIAEIAYDTGFNDLKYFRECFKEFFKLTPSEYKKKHTV